MVKRVMVSSGIGRDMGVVVFRDIDEEGTFIYKFIKIDNLLCNRHLCSEGHLSVESISLMLLVK